MEGERNGGVAFILCVWVLYFKVYFYLTCLFAKYVDTRMQYNVYEIRFVYNGMYVSKW